MPTTCLPPHLAERLHLVSAHPPPPGGKWVLYWMHHAVRAHENPALDAARLAAAALDLPLLIYQGLAGRHRYNNDRHHCFILQGAAEAHAELAALGLRAIFHLPADPTAPSPLPTLAAQAALVVTEDFPAPPFPVWTARLAARVAAPVWALDCACVVPLRSQPRRFERAFEFRRHNAAAFAERLSRPWPAVTETPAPYLGPLPCTPLDWSQADLPSLIAGCSIDHSVPPIPAITGGATAGYARWADFRANGLADYHRRRNDVTDPDGVSRLSPWLHHGQVSPLRIAREAAATGGEGAQKFLDELLVWRELAHNFAAFTANPETLEALPTWARQTLDAHTADPRPALLDADTLARGRTGDRLWDLAQLSLLRHGALHNNLRMTWAKALPFWTPDPARALALLIDLNHRYALDGSDPNSYGGLLWALGLFDRPFTPERPVLGRLRPRPTTDQARRLDLGALARLVDRPATEQALRIAVIGAGLAGLAAAGMLQDQGHAVTLFEQGRSPGGRLGHRRLPPDLAGTDLPGGLDHGAQYLTAREPAFARLLTALAERGIVAPWSGRLGQWDGHGITPVDGAETRWVGVPGMDVLGRELAKGLDLVLQAAVAPPVRDGDGWLLTKAHGPALGRFDRVLITAPAPQAVRLLGAVPALAAAAATVGYAPCWTVLAVFADPLPLPWDGVFVNTGPLGWVAHDGSKPGRRGQGWVLDAAPDWSRAHLQADPATVIQGLLAALADLIGTALPPLLWADAHRWLHARAEAPLATDCLWAAESGIGAAGDWCTGRARAEGAWLSGIALAARVLGCAGLAGPGATARRGGSATG